MTLELKKRLVTGILGGSLLLALPLLGGVVGVFLMTLILALGMMCEFAEMTLQLKDRLEKKYALLLLSWGVILANTILDGAEFSLLILAFWILFAYFLWSAQRHVAAELTAHFQELMFAIFGLLYLVFLPLYLGRIYHLSHGTEWTLLFLGVVWAGDSGAYFIGKRYGVRKLYPHVSPQKTWEGVWGGLGASWLLALGFKIAYFPSMSAFAVFFIPLMVGSAAHLGDLCESFLKRAFHQKDSGSCLPGHGGFLDRFDGIVLSLPVMYACVRLLG